MHIDQHATNINAGASGGLWLRLNAFPADAEQSILGRTVVRRPFVVNWILLMELQWKHAQLRLGEAINVFTFPLLICLVFKWILRGTLSENA